MFIRFRDIVERSSILRYGVFRGKEAGMSVYLCDENDCINIDISKITDSTFGTISQVMFNCHYGGEKIYKVDGDIVGYGSDGEPLITNTKIIGELKKSKEVRYDFFVKTDGGVLCPYRDGKIIIPIDSYYLQNESMGDFIDFTPQKFSHVIRMKDGRYCESNLYIKD
jgi:hypothetical protein